MIDKLLTLKEAATILGIAEDRIRHLVDEGDIPAYQIGGMYLRFKEEQIFLLKDKYLKESISTSQQEIRAGGVPEDNIISNIKDFFYFNDFYIISAALIAGLIYIILKSIM